MTIEEIEAQVIERYPMPERPCRLTRQGIEGARNALRNRLIKENEQPAAQTIQQ